MQSRRARAEHLLEGKRVRSQILAENREEVAAVREQTSPEVSLPVVLLFPRVAPSLSPPSSEHRSASHTMRRAAVSLFEPFSAAAVR